MLLRASGLVDTVPNVDRTVNTIGITGTLATIALIYEQYPLVGLVVLLGAVFLLANRAD